MVLGVQGIGSVGTKLVNTSKYHGRVGDGISGVLDGRGATRVSEKSHAGEDRGIPPFKKRRSVHYYSVPFTLCQHVTAEGATMLAPAPCTNRKDKERATHHVCDV